MEENKKTMIEHEEKRDHAWHKPTIGRISLKRTLFDVGQYNDGGQSGSREPA